MSLTDIRLLPMSREVQDLLASADIRDVLAARRYLLTAYDSCPPMTHDQASVFLHTWRWWENITSDLEDAA